MTLNFSGLDRTQSIPAGTMAGNIYTFRVRACNDWACSSYSATTSTRTTTGGYCTPSPCPPPNVVDPGDPVEAGIEEQATMNEVAGDDTILAGASPEHLGSSLALCISGNS